MLRKIFKKNKITNPIIGSLIRAAWKSLANLQAIHLNLPELQERYKNWRLRGKERGQQNLAGGQTMDQVALTLP